MNNRPNILLIMTDEQRGDALGGLPGSPVDTPYLEELRLGGINFTHAYSACPVCVPARRTMFTGKKPHNHGVLMNYNTLLKGTTLTDVLKQNNYQTHLVGKLHLFPERKLYGFDSADWADAPYESDAENDYERYLKENGMFCNAGIAHGVSFNSWLSRPYHLEEKYHFTNWCAERAIRFLERRDPTVPFFLNLSIHQPHAPCTPPAYYFEKYMQRELPACTVGDWDNDFPCSQKGKPVNAWRVDPKNPEIMRYRAGYYGCVEHIDHQIGRVLSYLPPNTIVIFCSDHGEMLGDHGWIRKRSGYEPSAHIPFFIRLPKEFAAQKKLPQGIEVDTAIELMDLMPTLLDMLDLPVPEGVDGMSLLPAMRGEKFDREYIHGECARLETIGSGTQFMTDGKEKYIWYPALEMEQLFDLTSDPKELHNLSKNPKYASNMSKWRERMVKELIGRPEGFTDGKKLLKLDGPTPLCIDPELTRSIKSDDFKALNIF